MRGGCTICTAMLVSGAVTGLAERIMTTVKLKVSAGPETGSYRVIRGGSWYSLADFCRSSYRGNDPPDDRGSDPGFRLVYVP